MTLNDDSGHYRCHCPVIQPAQRCESDSASPSSQLPSLPPGEGLVAAVSLIISVAVSQMMSLSQHSPRIDGPAPAPSSQSVPRPRRSPSNCGCCSRNSIRRNMSQSFSKWVEAANMKSSLGARGLSPFPTPLGLRAHRGVRGDEVGTLQLTQSKT